MIDGNVKCMRMVIVDLVEPKGLLEEEVEVICDGEACSARVTADQVEDSLLKGFDGSMPAAGLKRCNFQFVFKEGVVKNILFVVLIGHGKILLC